MASIRAANGKLFFDFRWNGKRCREYSLLSDTKENRRRMQRVLDRIEADIAAGKFEYARYFPNSTNVVGEIVKAAMVPVNTSASAPSVQPVADIPTFGEFTETWLKENAALWRQSYRDTVRDIVDCHLVPAFGQSALPSIDRPRLLAFRSELAAARGRRAGTTMSHKRVNGVMGILGQILNEAADRYRFPSPYTRIKPLKLQKTDVDPFTLAEVKLILDTVRSDYRDYYTVRFFTGMRTGEIDGLQWQYIDFERRLILVRETIVDGRVEYTKTDGSQRDIQMSVPVYEALKQQFDITGKHDWVFCNGEGNFLDHNNVTKRVWYPLLRHLKLKERRPYQTRHTAATLWLASGENPEWIARQMGHTTTEMLFRVYSRYVPNLTRQDGSAFERLLQQSQTVQTIDASQI